MKEIDVGNDFYHRLANRNRYQGDGQNTAVDFRTRYLSNLDKKEMWQNVKPLLTLSFKNVSKIGPSFANEAFAYFMKYTDPQTFKKCITFKDISKIQMMIIDKELDSGYSKK